MRFPFTIISLTLIPMATSWYRFSSRFSLHQSLSPESVRKIKNQQGLGHYGILQYHVGLTDLKRWRFNLRLTFLSCMHFHELLTRFVGWIGVMDSEMVSKGLLRPRKLSAIAFRIDQTLGFTPLSFLLTLVSHVLPVLPADQTENYTM